MKFSKRELQVAELVGQGFGGTTISKKLGIPIRTIKFYKKNLFDKLGIERSGIPSVKLLVMWNCELFQIGLKEVLKSRSRKNGVLSNGKTTSKTFSKRKAAHT